MQTSNFKSTPLFLFCILLLISCNKREDDNPSDEQEVKISTITVNGVALDNGATGISIEPAFTIQFSSVVDNTKLAAAVKLTQGTQEIGKAIGLTDGGLKLVVVPAEVLAYTTPYTLKVEAGELGPDGQQLLTTFEVSFTTEIEPVPSFSAGDGSLSSPYSISTAEELDLVRYFPDNHYQLSTDINVQDVIAGDPSGWLPIGTLSHPFTGTFEGNGFTITGLMVQRTLRTNQGLFGVLAGNGAIRDLHLVKADVTGGSPIGALVGRVVEGRIESCSSTGTVSSVGSKAGGLVGSLEKGVISRSSSTSKIVGEGGMVGGLVGEVGDGTVEISFATGNIRAFGTEAGGLIGAVRENSLVKNCYATGEVIVLREGGGLIGHLAGTANSGYAIGAITIEDENQNGDFVGHAIGQMAISGSTNAIYYPSNQVINYNGSSMINTTGTAIDINSLSCSNPNMIFPYLDFSTVWSCKSSRNWISLSWE
ncbi:MAG: Ig-like domain-containing protein [Saprospiraceae bacterium]|nr:Ig-like domain-containing protein [Saprospiraceae bacterium]